MLRKRMGGQYYDGNNKKSKSKKTSEVTEKVGTS
jgi:hypothetical protein